MTALLKPMPKDALLRRPAPALAAQHAPVALVDSPAPEAPVLMHPATFAPRPPKEKEEEPTLNDLLAAFVPDDDDDDEPLEDCVPTSQMPVPVCVPLYEEAPRKRWFGR